ncbi:hypothetical protein [Actinomadura rugatobispora]|uniref:Uncharacterized protein n=1 Tax=Actinomadura rugatobispora TaxID=1994 RepID=A0ABW0ZXX0_9ACTN|nr:hypothetical protein GCM10010200_013970 [Actinomadura rugatobispora]
MLSKVWEKAGERLAGEATARLLTPVAVFWFAGLAAWAWRQSQDRSGGLAKVGADLARLPAVLQLATVLVAGLAIVVSALVTQRLSVPLLRLLEGYWPLGRGDGRRRRLHGRRTRDQERAGTLEAQRLADGRLPAREADELARLQLKLRNAPGTLEQTMPTRFGNRLRAAEMRPSAKHGLDIVACWPHLWLLLDDRVRSELARGRAEMDMAAHTVWWSLAVVVWTPLAWWTLPLGPLLAAAVYYGWLLPAAQTHGDLVEAAFDLFRPRIYQALRWPLPVGPQAEQAQGAELTRYVWQGLAPRHLLFETNVEGKGTPS